MQKYAAVFCYDGTEFCGWQRQAAGAPGTPGNPTIQETVEKAISSITGESPSVVGSGRTDSGVHAAGQVAHFVLENKIWDPAILRKGLNSLLPTAIRAIDVKLVALEFHAQRSAVRKQYSYYFQQGPCALPHCEPFSWWIRKKLDTKAMQDGLNHLLGEHDFKPFQASGAKPGRTTVRKILEAEVATEVLAFPRMGFEQSSLVRVRIVGTGFLKQMVRGIAGTLLQIGEGRREAGDFAKIIASGDRSEVGPTAPARALWLERVWYPD